MTRERKVELIEGLSGLMVIVASCALLVLVFSVYGAIWGDSEFWGRVAGTALVSGVAAVGVGVGANEVAKLGKRSIVRKQ